MSKDKVDDLKKEALDGLAGELGKDLTSDKAEVRKVAKKRLGYLQGDEDMEVRPFEEEPWAPQDLVKKIQDLEKVNSAIISPKYILDEEIVYTKEGVQEINREEQMQQVGVDLRLAKASKVVGIATLSVDKSQTSKPDFIDMQVTDNYYLFKAGELYSLDFMEDVQVPEGMAGFVKHRSTINRSIGTIESGWYDSGFESHGGCGAVFRPNVDVKIEIGFRCAQVVFLRADNATMYNGQYQNS